MKVQMSFLSLFLVLNAMANDGGIYYKLTKNNILSVEYKKRQCEYDDEKSELIAENRIIIKTSLGIFYKSYSKSKTQTLEDANDVSDKDCQDLKKEMVEENKETIQADFVKYFNIKNSVTTPIFTIEEGKGSDFSCTRQYIEVWVDRNGLITEEKERTANVKCFESMSENTKVKVPDNKQLIFNPPYTN